MKSHSSSLACDNGLPVPTRCSAGTQEPPGAGPFRPEFPPRCSAVSIHTARRTVNRGPQHLPNTPQFALLSCANFSFHSPRYPSLPFSQTPWSPCQPLSVSLLTLLGSPHQIQKSVTPESQQVFLYMASVPSYETRL